MGDRGEARYDRASSGQARDRAAADRAHAARDRDAAAAAAAEAAEEAEGAAKEIAELREALLVRQVIGQAQGRLMDRYNLDADAAFAVLLQLSQDTNIELRQIAVQVAAGGLDAQGLLGSQ